MNRVARALAIGSLLCVSAAACGGTPTLDSSATIDCLELDASRLLPAGHHGLVTSYESEVSPTSYGSCSATLDTNGDGRSDAWDELADHIWVYGGLTQTIGGDAGDLEILENIDLWTMHGCLGEHEPYDADGWTTAVACDRDGKWTGIFYLIAGEDEHGDAASVTCAVTSVDVDMKGRESDIDETCKQVLDIATGG